MSTTQEAVLDRDSVIGFGQKHKGKTVAQVLVDDPGYILWCVDNTKHRFTPEVLLVAHDSQVPPFVLKMDEFNTHLRVLNKLEKGLDPIGDQGIRQLHGFGDRDDIHRSLAYFERFHAFVVKELEAKRSLFIKL